MRKKRLCLTSIIASVAASAATLASAAGLGAGGSGAVLGQPLDFGVQVRLESGESLAPECVTADVMVGERRLPSAQVRATIEAQGAGSARIRVATLVAMDEPVIAVNLNVGCQTRLARNYIVLADPPSTAPAPAAAAPMVAAPAFAATPANVETLAPAAVEVAQAGTGAALATAATGAAAAVPPSTTAAARRSAAAPETPPSATPAAPRTDRRTERRTQLRTTAPSSRPATPRAERRVAAVEPPVRLRLDFVEPTPNADAAAVELALDAVAQAASAARAQAAAASATAARITSLERSVERLGGEARSSRDEAAQLREQLASAAGSGRWMLPLMALVMLLSALTAWLAWRLSSLQRERQQGWQATMAPRPGPTAAESTPSRQPTSPIPFVTSEIKLPTPAVAAPRPRGAPAWPPVSAAGTRTPPTKAAVVAPEPAMQRTEPMASPSLLDGSSPRDVSIDELIDLEQQAEFFVVLGQDEAAVDLLTQHLRDTGGGSPLPYLKLLEIHHRRGDRTAYERMRTRFNERFNAYAPEWGADLQAGRSLEDYAGILPRLQQVWARPLDAMAELEALLFRRSRGELFDLPAYREVLFLYSLARDLRDREAVDPHNVDLLLPLADGGEFSTTAPSPFLGLHPDDGAGRDAAEDRPTAPIDLDLSQGARPTSIFDPLNDEPLRPRP